MGTSTDAILFYGVTFDHEGDLVDVCDLDWKELKRGLYEYGDEEPNDEPLEDDDLDTTLREQFGVTLGRHCSGECSMPYLAVVDTETRARRGYPASIDPAEMTGLRRKWDAQLKQALEYLNITVDISDKGWWLVSMWW